MFTSFLFIVETSDLEDSFPAIELLFSTEFCEVLAQSSLDSLTCVSTGVPSLSVSSDELYDGKSNGSNSKKL